MSAFEQYSHHLDSNLNKIIAELKQLQSELPENHQGINTRIKSLEEKLNKLYLELFLRNLSQKFYSKVLPSYSDSIDLKNSKVIYGIGIDIELDDKTSINLVQFKDIPELLRRNTKLIQEVTSFLQGLIAFENNDFNKTIKLLEKITSKTFKNDFYYNQALGLSYTRIKDYDKSIKIFEDAIQYYDSEINKLSSSDRTGNKKDYYENLISDIYIASINLAESMKQAGKYDESKKYYQRALELNPGDQTALFGLGILYRVIGINFFNKNDYDGAIKSFFEASKHLSNSTHISALQFNYKTMLSIGVCFYHLGNSVEAQKNFNTFIENYENIGQLSEKEIESIIGGLYHTSRGNKDILSKALELSEKYIPRYTDHIKSVINGESEYKGEYGGNEPEIIIKP